MVDDIAVEIQEPLPQVVMIIADRVEKIATRISLSCPWLKRVGLYGFVFFLIKGLMWLLVPAVLFYLGS